jgi:hypothetical protein
MERFPSFPIYSTTPEHVVRTDRCCRGELLDRHFSLSKVYEQFIEY